MFSKNLTVLSALVLAATSGAACGSTNDAPELGAQNEQVVTDIVPVASPVDPGADELEVPAVDQQGGEVAKAVNTPNPGRIKLGAFGASMILPEGMSHTWQDMDGSKVKILKPKNGPEEEMIIIANTPITRSDSQLDLSNLLRQEVTAMVGQAGQIVAPPQDVTVKDKRGARMIVQVSDGQAVPLEIFAGVVVSDSDALFVIATYRNDMAKRKRARSVLGSLQFSKAQANSAQDSGIKSKLVGCWKYNSNSGGSGYTEMQWQFGSDGSYSHHYMMALGGGMGSNTDRSSGSYQVRAGRLRLVSNQGEENVFQPNFEGGFLTLGSNRYIPCG